MITGLIASYFGVGASAHIVARIGYLGWQAYVASQSKKKQQQRVDDTIAWLNSVGETDAAERIKSELKS